MLMCEIYAAVTVIITAIWMYTGRTYSLRTLAWAMFFPALFVPWFNEDPNFLERMLGHNHVTSSLIFSLVSVVFVIFTMALIFAVNRLTGWGKKTDKPENLVQRTTNPIVAFFKAAGEEIGWRCYLLPCLMQQYSANVAILISGVVWASYHLPIMILLTKRFSVRHRWKTVLVQSLQCIIAAYLFAYVAKRSGFSVWAPAVMHFTWNEVNPLLYGSIYTQQSGQWLAGEQWLVNGEGLAGCLSLLPLAVFVMAVV